MIRVLIVEDMQVEQELLSYILISDPQITVVGIANDGEEALCCMERLKPDVVTMDIHMPRLNGFDTTRRIMESSPLPIIIVSGSYNADDAHKSFQAIEAGALAIVRKPQGVGHPDFPSDAAELIKTVKMMSEVKVVRRWPRPRIEAEVPSPCLVAARDVPDRIRVVAIGASTGGPAIIQEIFSALPKDLSVQILVVQHMALGFMENFVKWVGSSSGFPSHIAINGEYPAPGHAYFAPDGLHMLAGRDDRIVLSTEAPENGLRPSVARLFRSVAETFGSKSAGVLLTGMGRDGAQGLLRIKEHGGMTIVQDEKSSAVFGMPKAAIDLHAADEVLPLSFIPAAILKLFTK